VCRICWNETHHGLKEIVDNDGKVPFEYDIENNSDPQQVGDKKPR
jgi:hypothetical protein